MYFRMGLGFIWLELDGFHGLSRVKKLVPMTLDSFGSNSSGIHELMWITNLISVERFHSD